MSRTAADAPTAGVRCAPAPVTVTAKSMGRSRSTIAPRSSPASILVTASAPGIVSWVQPLTVASEVPSFEIVPETTRPGGGGTARRSGAGGRARAGPTGADDAGAWGAVGAPPHPTGPAAATADTT